MTGPVIDTTATEQTDEPVDDGGFDYVPAQEIRDDGAAPALTTTDLAVPDQPPVTGELATVPPGDELRALAQLANTFAAAKLVPEALQHRPEDCLLVLLTARDLGLSITTAFRELHPIDGRVTASPKVKLAIIRQRRLGRVWPDPANDGERATWHATRADDPETTYTSTYTIADATTAGLTGKKNWRNYPARMLSWRALGYLIDDAFSEVGTGLYSADELGAVTDTDGRVVIDVTEVGPLDGMPAPGQHQGGQQAGGQPTEWASHDDMWQLQARILALPAEHVADLRAKWMANDRLAPKRPWAMPRNLMNLARSLVAGIEGAAAKDGYDRNVRPAELATSLAETVIMILSGRIWPDAPTAPAGPADAPDGSAPAGPAPEAPTGQPAANAGTLATSAANGRPGIDALEERAERRGRVTEVVTAEVQALTLEQVDDELRVKQLPTDGAGGQRRMRLIAAEVEARIGMPLPDEIHEQVAPLMSDDDATPPEEQPDE